MHGGVPPEFFECDGKVDDKDLALFLLCFKGRGLDTELKEGIRNPSDEEKKSLW